MTSAGIVGCRVMMTDEASKAEPTNDAQAEREVTWTRRADGDWLLEAFIKVINASRAEIAFTVQAGGFLVSGQLCSGQTYLEGFGQGIATALEASGASNAEHIRSTIAEVSEKLYAAAAGQTPTFIHLRNAKFYQSPGAPIPSGDGVWWRCRLADVVSFSLGEFQFNAS